MIVVRGEIKLEAPAGIGEKEKRLFSAMQTSRVTYSYASEEVLDFELRTRVQLMNAAEALNKSGAKFAVYKDSRCNPKFWRRTDKGGFQLLPEVPPAQGIRNIFEEGKLYAFECAMAIVIVLYKGMLEVLGDTLFNVWFGGILLYDWHYDEELKLVDSKKPEEALPGDVQYFRNPDVSPQYPEWQGENVLRMEDGLFYGHGLSMKTGEKIIEALNQKRKRGAQTSAYLTDVVVHPDYPSLYKALIGAGGTGTAVRGAEELTKEWIRYRIGFRTGGMSRIRA